MDRITDDVAYFGDKSIDGRGDIDLGLEGVWAIYMNNPYNMYLLFFVLVIMHPA